MKNPVPQTEGEVLDLAALAHELREEEAYRREGQTARTLLRSADLRVVLIALAAGQTISEHHARVSATVQTLLGHVLVRLPERSVEVPAGGLVALAAGLPHAVSAEVDSAFLLTLGWRADG